MTQKFHKGDLVRVAKDLGPSMSHFTADTDAIVIGSYKDQYGGGGQEQPQYTLNLKDQGLSSWYWEGQLELIARDQMALLAQWEAEKAAEIKQASDIDWIFEHGPEVVAAPHGATLERLGRDAGITNMWGSNGEGYTWHCNAMAILQAARPFLMLKDKAGWLSATGSADSAKAEP